MRSLIFILLIAFSFGLKSQNNTININYLLHVPFAQKDSLGPKGLEVEIINEYLLWLKTNKKIDLSVKYNSFTDYAAFINETKKTDQKSIGLGACITSIDKASPVEYSAPYLKNLSFCITNGNAPDIKSKTQPEIFKGLANMSALTVTNTILSNCVNEVKKQYIKELKITAVASQTEILNSIAKNVLLFGYVDGIEFWYFLKSNPGKFLKVQKAMDMSKETYSFIFPKGSEHKALFNEFFGTFKNGPKYRIILEKYLGGFMSQNMAIK